jgi:calcineurin-like phosphoesterase family protein
VSELRVNNKLWVWSDTHFGHRNIVKFQQRPETHETIMLDGWIRLVPDDAQILHLGDVFLGKQGNPTRWARIISRMPGEKFLVLGNHDKQNARIYEELAGFTILDPFITRVRNQRVAFTHYPLSETYGGWPDPDRRAAKADDVELRPLWTTDEWDVNVHGHIHLNHHHPEDGSPWEGKTYVNASVEALDLAPRQLGSLL